VQHNIKTARGSRWLNICTGKVQCLRPKKYESVKIMLDNQAFYLQVLDVMTAQLLLGAQEDFAS
jgi:hypothetical protein